MREPTVRRWKSRPVFVSSTFRDMQAERDYLLQRVVPRLEEELRKRRHYLEPVDLRQGVDLPEGATEEACELLVLKVCLAEIQRCRPFLIVLLGDRYGWVPASERIQAAASEAGFAGPVEGHSVTALEIEFGILKESPGKPYRCFFYLRDPLPYGQMPPQTRAQYSEAFATDAQASARRVRLQQLKARLTGKGSDLASRVRHYQAQWDKTANAVAGLDAWGEMVFQDLWGDFEQETHEFAAKPEPSWEEIEREALEEFVEHRSRHFTGREETLGRMVALAKSPAADLVDTSAKWGACVTGQPGSGKSALFAQLVGKLESEVGVFLLANAAGATPRGSSVDAMLRRWLGELALFLDVSNPLPVGATNEDVERVFALLLSRASEKKRVVVLLDALNQFESTPRARHVTWRPKLWPSNARLIATSLPGPQAEALAQWAGVEEIELPALTGANAHEIAGKIWRHWHIPWNETVWHTLAKKELFDSTPAVGNPLWTILACEQLALLDADHFERAEREFADERNLQTRLALLRSDLAEGMPPDVPSLYESLLTQIEKVHGVVAARSFAVAIAASRRGWRESDLRGILPRISGVLFPDQPVLEITPLKLAELRRAFRAHLVLRGTEEQWDFHHAQMRAAVERHAAFDQETRRQVHARIADFLETLPSSDAIIRVERMRQFIGERNALRAARYYATLDAGNTTAGEERGGPSWTLVEWIAAGEIHRVAGVPPDINENLGWILGWLLEPDLEHEEIHRLAYNFQLGLFEKLQNDVALGTRLELMRSVNQAMQRLTEADPRNARCWRSLALSHIKVGDVLRAQGYLAEALRSYRQSLEVALRLADTNPSNAAWQGDLALSQERIGIVLRSQGDLDGALRAYRQSLEVALRLAEADPSDTGWQHNLAVSQLQMGDVMYDQGNLDGALRAYRQSLQTRQRLADDDPSNAGWQRGLSVSQGHIGDALHQQGNLDGALRAYRQSLQIQLRLTEADPSNAGWRHDLSLSHSRAGNVLRDQGDLDGALRVYRQSLQIQQRLTEADPSNAGWQRDLALSHNHVGDVLHDQGDLDGALCAYRQSLQIRQRLAKADPSNAGWQRDLALSHNNAADVLRAQGDLDGALRAYRQSLQILQRLTAADPSNAGWEWDLSVSQRRIGDVLRAEGDLGEALRAYRRSLQILQRLTEADPSNAVWQRDLSVSHRQVADVLRDQGYLAEALRAYRQSLQIRQHLAEADPSNAVWQHDLATGHIGIGDAVRAQGDLDGAMLAYRRSLETFQRLVESDSSNVGWQRDLSLSLERVGDVLRDQGDLPEALRAYRQSLQTRQLLGKADPSNAGWQRDLSVSHEKAGDVLRDQGDLDGALRAYRQSLEVAQRLAEADPSNAGWQNDLSVSQEKVGDVLSDQGDPAGALPAYRQSLQIRQRLAEADPTNAAWQRDLSLSLGRVGDVLSDQGDLAGALRLYRQSLEIRQRLAEADPSNADWQRDLSVSFQRLGIIAARAANIGEAAHYFGKSHAVLRGMRQRRLHFNASLFGFFEQLERFAPSGYVGLIAAAATPSSSRLTPPPPAISIPRPPAPSEWELSVDSLRESAERCFKKSLWEAAATALEKLLAQNDPIEQVAPKLIQCLLNAHETLLPRDAAKAEDILHRLESAGHGALALELRRQLDTKQPKPAKPWWKLW